MADLSNHLHLAAPAGPRPVDDDDEDLETKHKRDEIRDIAGDSQNTIEAIRDALRRRSGKAWSVSRGRGTSYGWITIISPPRRCAGPFRYMTNEDRTELGELLGLSEPVHFQGEHIPASTAYRRVYLARALYGDSLGFTAEPYWD